MTRHHLERVLFVVAGRHCGKSTQLRSMFRDARLGNRSEIPSERKLKDFHRLTNERFLYLRVSSPHELKESSKEFLRKTREKVEDAPVALGRRWNFACALQVGASNKMPDFVESVKLFVDYFEPERARVVFLSPDRNGEVLPNGDEQLLQWKFFTTTIAWLSRSNCAYRMDFRSGDTAKP